MKVIKKTDLKELLEKTFNSALKKDESTDIISLDSIEINSIYATIKYSFKARVANESSCIQTISGSFSGIIKKYIPEKDIDVKLVIPDNTIYIHVAYSIVD